MTDPTVAERMRKLLTCSTHPVIGIVCGHVIANITTALAEARREGCSEVLVEAQALGYLDHADACRKSISSETCTS